MPSDEVEMLRAIGLQSVDDLFADIPAAVRIPKLDLPDGLPEDVVVARVTSMLAANKTVVDMPTFLGGGSFDHFVPASVRAITARSEFYTSYTPYQPEISHATKAIFVVGVNPIAQAIVRPPGDFGADIVIGEGQPLGTPMNFGGPLLGIFACRQEHIRKMPGRVIGLTRDANGHRAFCMTLQTREQHIRREKAMSNICTNESLLAVAAATYLSVLGSNGLRRLAADNIRRARGLAASIDKISGFTAPIFRRG